MCGVSPKSAKGAASSSSAIVDSSPARRCLVASSNAPHGVILTAELEPQCDRHAGDVAPAVNGVTARQRDQRDDWIGLSVDERADLLSPGLIDPIEPPPNAGGPKRAHA